MKIAFPVESNKGLESSIYGHFGTAPCFVIVDAESGEVKGVDNRDAQHLHGQCQPLKALGDNPVDAVIVGGIGGGALSRLQASGIRVFRAVGGSLRENMELIRSGKLPEFAAAMTCAGHRHGGGCDHH
ncbi:MAG: NifB/NifX family molybdenum-iron cluster-binding protein [Thermodesulfobacteriota bacterium]